MKHRFDNTKARNVLFACYLLAVMMRFNASIKIIITGGKV